MIGINDIAYVWLQTLTKDDGEDLIGRIKNADASIVRTNFYISFLEDRAYDAYIPFRRQLFFGPDFL